MYWMHCVLPNTRAQRDMHRMMCNIASTLSDLCCVYFCATAHCTLGASHFFAILIETQNIVITRKINKIGLVNLATGVSQPALSACPDLSCNSYGT